LQSDVPVAVLAHELLLDARLASAALLLGEGLFGTTLELAVAVFVERLRVLGVAAHRGAGVVAEDEADAVVVPPVEVARQREVGVATEQDVPKATSPAERDGPIEVGGGAVVRGAVAAPVDDGQHLTRVRERDDERVVAPDPLV